MQEKRLRKKWQRILASGNWYSFGSSCIALYNLLDERNNKGEGWKQIDGRGITDT